jgi:hypothetical protein
MRLGQAVCDYVELPSDPEIRVCIVPLTEAQYRQVLEKVASVKFPDDMSGAAIKDRVLAQETLVRAIRQEHDLAEPLYDSVEDLLEDFDVYDIDHVIDCYNEMVEKSSPAIDGLSPEDLERLKKVLPTMDWNALSGSAWYAAKRFLSRISQVPVLDNSLGSTSTNSSTTTSE